MLARLFTEQFSFARGDSVLVIGLGRFGGAVADSLMRLDHDVLGIDARPEVVQQWADQLTHAVELDGTNAQALRQLGAADFAHAVVGIGSDMAASLMTVMALVEVGVKDIWAKAISPSHGQLAQRIGAHHVVYPEADMGERVAHQISGRMIDFIEFDDGFAIAKIHAPTDVVGQSLAESRVRERFGVTVVGVKRPQADFVHATAETRLEAGDVLIVSGPTRRIEGFAGRREAKRAKA